MLFKFLKYLQPTSYFQLYRKDGTSIFPIVSKLPVEITQKLTPNPEFKSELAKEYDLSWQAIKKGYFGNASTYKTFEKVPVIDEYRFIRLYFHPVWALYVFLIRLFTFKNPVTEWKGWNSTKKVKRKNNSEKIIIYPDWDKNPSKLINEGTLVSVVIPTLNRYSYLKDVLQDFEKQTYSNFEILIVDQSQPFQKEFYRQFNLNINLIRQEEPALWLARNTAIEKAKGTVIALSEDDVRVPDIWIENHLRCLDYFDADVSAGVFYPEGSSIPKDRSFFSVASQFATGNAALYRNIFKKTGLFDRQFEKQRMGDSEFGLRVFLEGMKSVSNPYASCIDVKAGTGGLRQLGSWDAFRPKKWFAPRPIPSVLYLYRKYYGSKRAIYSLLKTVPPSVMPYRFKKNRKLLLVGVLISLFLFPIILIQVLISWQKASKKLTQGAKISELS
ncbi:glycosyltransferase family 2 protein [Marixanthomonas ophiurae]|uniref:Glycosyltransferase family 2 protein n=1 Tax=Marixanthomonas ophiurae TaxID=387659 RepID=A0A3E1QD71_9FLAO|nr:glycosyltransferase family A protein [Marixanthomonas ophiurae]RFN60057.1 glycosyltransferase family 2 protein [Marixanthomonas ophiurae]